MSARMAITQQERQALLRRRIASAEAAKQGRAHRALPLDEVEARQRAKCRPWPNVCPRCNAGTATDCDCMPCEAASAVSDLLRDPPRPAPPPYPWRRLGAGALVLLVTLAAVHVATRVFPPAVTVAAR